METYSISTLLFAAYAVLSAGVTCISLVRIGNFRLAAILTIAMFIIRFVSIQFIDLEPPGKLSTFRDSGTPLPAWLVAAGYFEQFGVWGAFLATSILHGRSGKNKDTALRQDSETR